jgi:hypothetical protein
VNEYRLLEDLGWDLGLKFRLGDRVQPVWITRYGGGDGEDWAVIESPIGDVEKLDIVHALEMVSDVTVGGLALSVHDNNRVLTLRHAVPLSNLDINELEIPLRRVTMAADTIEAELTGQDKQR